MLPLFLLTLLLLFNSGTASSFSFVKKYNEVDLGTTLVALAFEDGVVVAADSRTSTDEYVSHRYADKIVPIHSQVVVARSGSAADTQALCRHVQLVNDQRFYRHNCSLNVAQVANFLKAAISSKNQQLRASLLVAGLNNGVPKIYSISPSGVLFEEARFAAAGSGSTVILGWLDDQLSDKNKVLSQDEAIDLCRRAVKLAMQRDGKSGGLVRLFVVCSDELKQETVFPDHSSGSGTGTGTTLLDGFQSPVTI
jgi:20S proteasome subunit beta 1